MKDIIVGTAGHIDHGKTALVKALTGIDADRLEEEKRRGITIDIGFAHLQLSPELRLGFVDVPGHERFVKNMLAGVGGIDLVLFVVAAEESIKPQTREHFDICRLLGIRTGVVALTKADLVDQEILDLARLEVEEFVAGSFLQDAPLIPVSSKTGLGLEELRSALARVAASIPTKDSSRYARLPIDRAFSIKGFGAVVTGTLVSGSVEQEQQLELHPSGRKVRVRGVEVYGAPASRALAGQRTALNLADVSASELDRGMVLTSPGLFRATLKIDCEIELLRSAKPLKHRSPVHFHAGTAEVAAELRLLGGATAIQPGEKTFARLVLQEPILLLPRDRFIVRMFSPVITIGGGVVLDIEGPRYRRADRPFERLQVLAGSGAEDSIALLVREAPFGMSVTALVTRTGLLESEVLGVRQSSKLVFIEQPQPWLVDAEWFAGTGREIEKAVSGFHKTDPLQPGIAKQDLRNRLLPDAPLFLVDALLSRVKSVLVEGEIVRLATHRLVLKQDEEQARVAIERAFEQSGLAVPPLREVLEKSGVEPGRARTLLQILIREKRLVRVSEDLVFHQTAILKLKQTLAPHKSKRFSVPEFKDWTGISRKYAIPLLEYLDREHVTRREGDLRLVL